MVINFAIKDDPNAAVFIAERLVTALDVNNAEAAHSEPDVLLDKEAAVVGSAVHDSLVHRRQGIAIDALLPIAIEDATDPAHNYTLIPLGSLPGTIKSPFVHTRNRDSGNTTFF